jgi:hypothetical protein
MQEFVANFEKAMKRGQRVCQNESNVDNFKKRNDHKNLSKPVAPVRVNVG